MAKIPFLNFGSTPVATEEIQDRSADPYDEVVASLSKELAEPPPEETTTNWLHNIPETSPLVQIGIMMVLSLGLHGLVMLVPWGGEKKVEAVKQGEKKIRITQLPPATKPGAVRPSTAKPNSQTTPPPLKPPVIKPSVVANRPIIPPVNKPVIPPLQPKAIIPKPKPIKVAESPKPKPEPKKVAESPKPKPEPSKVAESPKPKPEPSKVAEAPKPKPEPSKVAESPKPKPEPSKAAEPLASGQEIRSADFMNGFSDPTNEGSSSWDDFPKFPNAQGGCNNVASCQQTTADVAAVASFFEKELPLKKYENKSTEATGDRKVYQISRGGLVQFLTILNAPGKGAQYVLAPEPLKMSDFSNVAEVPPEVGSILAEAGGVEASRATFANPDNFFVADKTRSEIADIKVIQGISASDCFDTYFRTNLVNKGFEPTQTPTPYGGGSLYTAVKEQVTLYINLVPTTNGNDTAVVVWRRMPS